ncbi:hypothetical protein Tco_0633171 [Tanacetum coccineum]
MISPAFVEANYEILESLLRKRRRQIRNEDLRIELEYFSEDYDEEREMELRPEPHREATPTLRPRSPVVHRHGERVVGSEDAPNREESRRGRNAEGIRPSEIEAREGENNGSAKEIHKDTLGGSQYQAKRRTRSLVEHLSTDLPSTYKGLMEKTYTWIEAREVATNGTPNDQRENFKRSKSPKEILAIEKAAKSFEQPPHMFGSRQLRDMSKYFHFHEDHRHDTNDCRQLRNQIEEAVKSGQLSHLVKGIKKERVKASENQRTKGKKDKSTAPAEAPNARRLPSNARRLRSLREIAIL